MRSMVEGASELELRCRRRIIVESDAPSTALRAVPLPRFRGAGKKLPHRNAQSAQIEIDLQSDLLAGQREDGALLVAQRDELRAGAHCAAGTDRAIDAGDVGRAADIADGAVEVGLRRPEHEARAQAADRDRIVLAMERQRAAA